MSRKNLAYQAISTIYKRFRARRLRNRAKSARPRTTFGGLGATYSVDDDPLMSFRWGAFVLGEQVFRIIE
jgi:hypothetical protein